MTDTPIGDQSAADNGVTAPPVDPTAPPAPADPTPAPADPEPAPVAAQEPFLVKSLAEAGPVRYGIAVGARRVQYDVQTGTDPNTGKPIMEHVDFTELAVAWFDGEVGGAHAESVEPVEFDAQG